MKNKEKNGFSRLLLPEMLTVLIGGAAVYGLGLLGKQLSVENALRDAVMAALGLAVSGFFLRREVVDSRLDYDNGEHLMRFWDRCLVQPFVFAGLCIPSGGRMAVSGGLCGIVPVQQSISGNCVFRGVSDDCHAVGTVSGHFFPVFYQRCFCSLSFPAFRAGICHRDPPVLISVLPFAVRDRKCGTACQ